MYIYRIRDTVIYLGGIFCILMFLLFEFVNIYSSLILFFYYFINYTVLSNNSDLKE
jgi:Ca2+/Na+ antiporter